LKKGNTTHFKKREKVDIKKPPTTSKPFKGEHCWK